MSPRPPPAPAREPSRTPSDQAPGPQIPPDLHNNHDPHQPRAGVSDSSPSDAPGPGPGLAADADTRVDGAVLPEPRLGWFRRFKLRVLYGAIRYLNFFRIHVIVFVFAPLVASGIFYAANSDVHIAYIDCLFNCVSAMTVTGLTTINVSEANGFQQSILYVLMWCGNISTVGCVMVFVRRYFFRKRFEHLVRHDPKIRRRARHIQRQVYKQQQVQIQRVQRFLGRQKHRPSYPKHKPSASQPHHSSRHNPGHTPRPESSPSSGAPVGKLADSRSLTPIPSAQEKPALSADKDAARPSPSPESSGTTAAQPGTDSRRLQSPPHKKLWGRKPALTADMIKRVDRPAVKLGKSVISSDAHDKAGFDADEPAPSSRVDHHLDHDNSRQRFAPPPESELANIPAEIRARDLQLARLRADEDEPDRGRGRGRDHATGSRSHSRNRRGILHDTSGTSTPEERRRRRSPSASMERKEQQESFLTAFREGAARHARQEMKREKEKERRKRCDGFTAISTPARTPNEGSRAPTPEVVYPSHAPHLDLPADLSAGAHPLAAPAASTPEASGAAVPVQPDDTSGFSARARPASSASSAAPGEHEAVPAVPDAPASPGSRGRSPHRRLSHLARSLSERFASASPAQPDRPEEDDATDPGAYGMHAFEPRESDFAFSSASRSLPRSRSRSRSASRLYDLPEQQVPLPRAVEWASSQARARAMSIAGSPTRLQTAPPGSGFPRTYTRFSTRDRDERRTRTLDPIGITGMPRTQTQRTRDTVGPLPRVQTQREDFPRTQTIGFADDTQFANDGFSTSLPTQNGLRGRTTTGNFSRTQTYRSGMPERTPTYRSGMADRTATYRSGMGDRTLTGRTWASRKNGYGMDRTNTMLDTMTSGFGGWPTPGDFIMYLYRRLKPPKAREQTMPRMNTITSTFSKVQDQDGAESERPTGGTGPKRSYFSFDVLVSRNSRFHHLTEVQREELGGVEYRALDLLSKLVPIYILGVNFLCIVLVAPYAKSRAFHKYVPVFEEQKPFEPGRVWWVFFNTISAYSNTGMSLIDTSFQNMQDAYLPMTCVAFLILAGNTAFPIFLRLFIWMLSKLVPSSSRVHESLTFLLDHPRRCFVYLFPSPQTWFLVLALLGLKCVFVFDAPEAVTDL